MRKETRIISTASIKRPIEDVFNFGTTPRYWPEWHPTAQAVSGAVDHSLEEGEQVLEKEKFLFLTGSIRWTMHKRAAPTLWIIDGILEGIPLFQGTTTTITYTLTPDSGGTLLHREMIYRVPNLPARWIDSLIFKTHNAKQSQLAVDRLKNALEAD